MLLSFLIQEGRPSPHQNRPVFETDPPGPLCTEGAARNWNSQWPGPARNGRGPITTIPGIPPTIFQRTADHRKSVHGAARWSRSADTGSSFSSKMSYRDELRIFWADCRNFAWKTPPPVPKISGSPENRILVRKPKPNTSGNKSLKKNEKNSSDGGGIRTRDLGVTETGTEPVCHGAVTPSPAIVAK